MKMTGAQIIIETLIEQGTDTVFGYPGGFVINIYDELFKNSDRIRHITTCHEQGASHAADGYARATGKTGVVIATSGPGATNLVTGIATAYLDSTPMVAITGNVPLSLIGRDSFQEVDIAGITMPITKHNFMVKDIEKLADTIREAFKIARSGRPGPVLVDIPKDVQTAEIDFINKEVETVEKEYKNGKKQFEKAVNLIKEAKRPFIYAGGGVVSSNASEELKAFSETIDAPIGCSMMGLSSVDSRNPSFLGMTGMHGNYASNTALSESDLIVAIGARFSDRATGNKILYVQGKKVIHIDIDPAEIGKNIPAFVSLIGDVKAILTKLNNAIEKCDKNGWGKRVEEIKKHPDSRLEMGKDKLNPQLVIETVNKYAGGALIATDVGQHQMWTAQYYRFTSPRSFITSGGLGTMGFGLGAAIGASVATGKKTVLFTSDGSFHMNMNEMATAVSNNLPVVVVVLNNSTLGMVRQWQSLFFGCRYSNTSLCRRTDYVALAEAFGAKGRRVYELSDLDGAIQEAMKDNSPSLIEVLIDTDQKVLPMIPPGGSISDIIVKA